MTDVINRGAKLFNDSHDDYNHATDSEYKRLRAEADKLFQKRNQLSQQSQQAYKQGDGQKAHDLSEESKRIMQQADQYNRQAAEYVFRENNADSAADEIDLHGLYVKEAEYVLQNRISQAIKTNQSHLRVIVGKGKHSQNGIAKIKPAVDQLCDESRLNHHIDPKNSGVLIIDLQNTNSGQIPQHWGNVSQPQQAYHGANQPQYQQQNQHHQQNQQHYQQQNHTNNQNIKTGNQFIDLALKAICFCINR